MVLQGSYEEAPDLFGAKGDKGEDAPSPFVGETHIQYAWDATSLEAVKRCPRFYQYTIVENWQSKVDNIHLRFGQEVHYAIEDYEYAKAAGYKHDDALHLTVRALLDRIQEWNPTPVKGRRSEELKSKDNLVRSVVWYLEHYEHDSAKTVILDNGKPAVELSFQFELGFALQGTPVLLCGHLDKVVHFGGDLYVMDHKTATSTVSTTYFNQFDPNNQMTAYSVASQTIMKAPIKGVIVDAIQVASDWTRPVRSFTLRSADRLYEWLRDTQIWVEQAASYAERNYWPQNDASCTMYGGCRFRDVCSKSPQVREHFLKDKFTQEKERWNPLKPR